MANQREQLSESLIKVGTNLDGAIGALDAARHRADEVVEWFVGLGGSADRAQNVADSIADLQFRAATLDGEVEEVSSALDEVHSAITPDDNIAKLDVVVQRATTTAEATVALIETCGDAEDGAQGHLAGSRFATELSTAIGEAREHLEDARTALSAISAEARVQQDAFGESSVAGSGAGDSPRPSGPGTAAPSDTPPVTRSTWRGGESRRRAERTAAEADRSLENPLPRAPTHGHGHARHGHQTTDEQQALRVRTRIAPDGRVAPTTRATASAVLRRKPKHSAGDTPNWRPNCENGSVPSHTDPATGARSYSRPGDGRPVRHTVVVETDDPLGFGDSAQVARRVAGPNSPHALDAAGNRIPDRVTGPQRHARIVFEYVPSADEWRPLTYFPEP